MFATFNPRKDTHKISGVPVKVESIISDTATVTLPNGRKGLIPVKDLVTFHGDITFNGENSAQVIADDPTSADTEATPEA